MSGLLVNKKSIIEYARQRNIEVVVEETVIEFASWDSKLISDLEAHIMNLRKRGRLQLFYQSHVQKRRNDSYGFRIVFHKPMIVSANVLTYAHSWD